MGLGLVQPSFLVCAKETVTDAEQFLRARKIGTFSNLHIFEGVVETVRVKKKSPERRLNEKVL